MGIEVDKIMMPMQNGDVRRTWTDVKELEAFTECKPKMDIAEGVGKFVPWLRMLYEN